MKKYILLLALILSVNSISFASFLDVKNYSKEIDYLISKGIINGYEDNTFRPEDKITRAELVKMIVTATGKTGTAENNFIDVEEEHWAKDYINIAVANNLIKGDPEGTFRPDDKITYGEVVTVLVRTLNKENDAEKNEVDWPLNYMKQAEKLNIFNGYMSNDLVATNEARRDSVALMIYNMLNPIASNDEENSEEIETGKINTKTAYAGFVTAQLKRSAEDRVKVIDTEGTEVELKLADKKLIPGINSFIIYQFNLSGEINIRKELKISDIDNSFLLVNKIEDTIVKLAGEEKPLDLELDEYRVGGKTIKLNKINFFIIELDTEENEFVDYKLYNMNELKLKENDKLKFDDKLNVCYVVRELD